jgi:hypothetical protein
LNFENGNETLEEVWILLTRHVVDSRRISEFISLKVEIEDELTSNSKAVDHTTISAKVRELMLWVITVLISKSVTGHVYEQYTRSCPSFYTRPLAFVMIVPQVRTRILPSQKSGVLSIFTSYDGGSTEIGFTLTVYAGENFVVAWDEQVAKPLFTNKVNNGSCSR